MAARRRRRRRGRRRVRRWLWIVALGTLALAAAALALRPRNLPAPPLAPPRFVPAGAENGGREPSPRRARPRVAIVVDDLGDSLEAARGVLDLAPPSRWRERAGRDGLDLRPLCALAR